MRRALSTVTILLLLLAAAAAAPPAESPRALILLSNDDGVGAQGLEAIYRSLTAFADVVVVAPADNQSGVSHNLHSWEPIYVRPYKIDGKEAGVSLKTTPAMCVIMGLEAEGLLTRKPDLVVAGINRGSNPGWVTWISGTAAAARQAAMRGLKSIALSMERREGDPYADYDAMARAVTPLIRKALETPFPPGVFLNVNGPAGGSFKGIIPARDSQAELSFKFARETNIQGKTYYWAKGGLLPGAYPDDTDWGAVQKGYITVTALTCRTTPDTEPADFLGKLGLTAAK
ncbi:MAG: 5'/3'-nucleotidase SurE [Acidobacteria bacterium]|nr:5'/3'-nucleotidase SurE [Acidobacteriota bacterium]